MNAVELPPHSLTSELPITGGVRFGDSSSRPISDGRSRDGRVYLLAEDSENDAFLTERAFRTSGISDPLHVVADGDAAITYLRGDAPYQNRKECPRPDVVLLDLGLPGKSGFEVLSWMRAQPDFDGVIIVILTASNREADADRAYELGANFYLTKPGNFEGLVRMTRSLHGWMHANHFSVRVGH